LFSHYFLVFHRIFLFFMQLLVEPFIHDIPVSMTTGDRVYDDEEAPPRELVGGKDAHGMLQRWEGSDAHEDEEVEGEAWTGPGSAGGILRAEGGSRGGASLCHLTSYGDGDDDSNSREAGNPRKLTR
jgi:hypothetical protein